MGSTSLLFTVALAAIAAGLPLFSKRARAVLRSIFRHPNERTLVFSQGGSFNELRIKGSSVLLKHSGDVLMLSDANEEDISRLVTFFEREKAKAEAERASQDSELPSSDPGADND